MAKEPEFKRGEKGWLKRWVNVFKDESKIALDDFETNAKNSISEVNRFQSELTGEIESLKETISSLDSKKQDLETKLDEVSEFRSSIFEEDEEGNILSEEVEGFVDQFKEYKAEVEDLKKEIDEYRSELFGFEDDEGNEVTGLNHKIESLKTQLQTSIKESQKTIDNFITENNNKRDELFAKIEGLLKGASTVALAKAFQEHKDSFVTSNRIWMGVFVFSIISMMVLSIWGFIYSEFEFTDMWKYTLGNLPFLGGAIWLAIYASRQRSQNKRLQQEYAFKEDVAKIYYGLKEEVEELGETELGKKLNESVLKVLIDVVSLNPSESLESKSHNDNGPILEGLKNVSEMVKKTKDPT